MSSSWPGLSRPSKPRFVGRRTWMPGTSPGMTRSGEKRAPPRPGIRRVEPISAARSGRRRGCRGRDDRGVAAGVGRRGVHVGIDARGRAEHAVGFGQLVAERFPGLAGGGAIRGRGQPIGWGTAGGALRGRRRGRLRRRRRGGRSLRDRTAGGGDQEAGQNDVQCCAHERETRRAGAMFPGVMRCDWGSPDEVPPSLRAQRRGQSILRWRDIAWGKTPSPTLPRERERERTSRAVCDQALR